MTDVDFKNSLLAGEEEEGSTEETRDIPTKTGVITVRGLTRAEVLKLNGSRDSGKLTVQQWEQEVISLCIISMSVSPAEVAKWQESTKVKGTAGKVSDAIMELSGLTQGADKSGLAGIGE